MSEREGIIFPANYDPAKTYNGCGPDITQKIPFVRRGLGSSSFFQASCEVHDYQYSLDDKTPASEAHRRESDDLFLVNMHREIETRVTNWFYKILRKTHARLFHWAVRKFGKNFYKKREG